MTPSWLPAASAAAAAAAAAAATVYLLRRSRLPPRGELQPELGADASLLRRLLHVIEHEILPKTRAEVAEGNKVFGAAILNASFDTVIAETNHETACPIFHGEIYTIDRWAALCDKPPPQESVFLATHEPCCLCISAIVWTGFRRCFYLYPYETTKQQGGFARALPTSGRPGVKGRRSRQLPTRRHPARPQHHVRALAGRALPGAQRALFDRGPAAADWCAGEVAARRWHSARDATSPPPPAAADALPPGDDKAELEATVARITKQYDLLACKYHSEKAANPNNKMAFN